MPRKKLPDLKDSYEASARTIRHPNPKNLNELYTEYHSDGTVFIDGYTVAVNYFTLYQERIQHEWDYAMIGGHNPFYSNMRLEENEVYDSGKNYIWRFPMGRLLFGECYRVARPRACGCPTQVRAGVQVAENQELTAYIRGIVKIPEGVNTPKITWRSLKEFAEVNRELDKELGRGIPLYAVTYTYSSLNEGF